jgi:anhydro-N-acetylmuramic acid kinase
MTSYLALGLMSGTSLDGLDLCAAQFECSDWASAPVEWRILAAETIPYDAHWQQQLTQAPQLSAEAFSKLHADFGHYLGLSARQFLLRHQLRPQVVTSHGHTVFHQPWRQFTTQIGCGESLVTHLDAPLVADLRTRDVALGGQGAPLVPYGEARLFAGTGVFVNLGGIVNLSLHRAHLAEAEFEGRTWQRGAWPVLGYDVCPGNQVLNALATAHDPSLAFDPAGSLAESGEVDYALLTQLEAEADYAQVPPRSMGREFVEQRIMPMLAASKASLPDKLATMVEHIALRVAAELDRFSVRRGRVLVTGGGAYNATLLRRLDRVFAERELTREPATDQLIAFKEALAFAYLGLCTLLRIPNVLPGTTGAARPVVAGAIHLPESYQRSLL